jgi:hypothetical protein
MADSGSKLPLTEIAMITAAVGGAIMAYVTAVATPSVPLLELKGLALALLSIGGSVGGYRVSKKLTEIKDEKK